MRSAELFQERISVLRNAMRRRNVDAFITSHSPSLRYLCGFSGTNGLLLVSESTVRFFTDSRYEEQVRLEVVSDSTSIVKGNLFLAAHALKLFRSIRSLGVETDHLSAAEYAVMKKRLGRKELVSVAGLSENVRAVKDRSEMLQLRTAFDISDSVFRHLLDIIRPGIRELDISAEISYLHKKFGAEKDAFDAIVLSGSRTALPHGRATAKKIRAGEFVMLDFGCVVGGYHSDMTRTLCVGKPTAEMKKVYQTVLHAQTSAVDAVRNGVRARRLDTIARQRIARSGYGKYFGHSLGHGVGLEIHELPRIAPNSKEIIHTGNVITIEPGIYLPGKFGVRIEDTVAVRENGCEVLTRSPKFLTVL